MEWINGMKRCRGRVSISLTPNNASQNFKLQQTNRYTKSITARERDIHSITSKCPLSKSEKLSPVMNWLIISNWFNLKPSVQNPDPLMVWHNLTIWQSFESHSHWDWDLTIKGKKIKMPLYIS